MGKQMTIKAYTEEQQARISTLFDCIEHRTVPMAVVDYLGKQYQVLGSNELKFAYVTEETELSERFGVRDLRHVAIYGLTVVRKNRSALSREYVEKIGYDPFEDDPSITPEEVQRTLEEYDAEVSAA